MEGEKRVGWSINDGDEDSSDEDSVDEDTVPFISASSVSDSAQAERNGQPGSRRWADLRNGRAKGRRKSSTAQLALERLVRTRERLWSTAVASAVACIPTLLLGFTLAFPAPVLLELTADSAPEKYKFGTQLSEIFGV